MYSVSFLRNIVSRVLCRGGCIQGRKYSPAGQTSGETSVLLPVESLWRTKLVHENTSWKIRGEKRWKGWLVDWLSNRRNSCQHGTSCWRHGRKTWLVGLFIDRLERRNGRSSWTEPKRFTTWRDWSSVTEGGREVGDEVLVMSIRWIRNWRRFFARDDGETTLRGF